MARYFKIPFASTGDKVVIPDATQPDGSVSFTQGFGFDYERPNTDPAYKPVPREGTNGILHDVTEAVGVIQRQGVADWTIDAQPYPINAQVYHNGKQWLALRANSVAPTEGADWSGIGTANQLATKANTSTQVIAGTGLSGGGTLAANRTLSVNYGTAAGTAAQGNDSRITGAVQKSQVVQATGTSTTDIMSQKTVTDALATKANTSTQVIAGTCTTNGTTNNTVQLTNIVTTLGLEAGDVIRIQYSGYNKLHTVESITDGNSIIVNYEHAGNRGNGSLKLPNTTAGMTVTRIAKWYNAPVGLGQAWVYVTGSRVSDSTYSSIINRTLQVSVFSDFKYDNNMFLYVGGVRVGGSSNGSTEIVGFNLSAPVPPSSTYKYVGRITSWAELR